MAFSGTDAGNATVQNCSTGGPGNSSDPQSILKKLPDIRLIGMIKYRSGSGIERYRPVNDIGRFWEEIARALNVYEVHIANAKGKNDMVAAAYEVVRLWLSYDVDASWEKLIDAMAVQEELNPAIENLKTALRNMAITGSTGEKSIASNGSNTQSILQKRPDIRLIGMIKYRSGSDIERYRPVNDIGRFWEEIARALKVNEACIANAKGKNDMVRAANEVVRVWLDCDVYASWEKLIDAMEVKEELNPAIENLKTALLNMV